MLGFAIFNETESWSETGRRLANSQGSQTKSKSHYQENIKNSTQSQKPVRTHYSIAAALQLNVVSTFYALPHKTPPKYF